MSPAPVVRRSCAIRREICSSSINRGAEPVANTILDLAAARQAREERKARESQREPDRQPNPLLDPANLEDPYPAYARLRRRTPVWRIPESQGPGQWLVSRYAEVQRVLSDPRCSAE